MRFRPPAAADVAGAVIPYCPPSPTAGCHQAAESHRRPLAPIEWQLIMQHCDRATLLVLARCSRPTLAAASQRFAWTSQPPVALHCHSPSAFNAWLQPSLLRHADLALTWSVSCGENVGAVEVAAVASQPRLRSLAVTGASVSRDAAPASPTFSDESAALLFGALREQIRCGAAIESLSVSDLELGGSGFAALAAFVERSHALTTLHLSDLRGADPAGAQALVFAVAKSSSLRSLRIVRVQLGEAGSALSDALTGACPLVELVLDNCGLSEDSIHRLAEGVRRSGGLQRLDLSNNLVGNLGAAALASALEQSVSLADLQLDRCSIGGAGMEALATGVARSRSLRRLHVTAAYLTPTGAASLAHALSADGSRLASLSLHSCIAYDAAGFLLARAMETNSTLEELRLVNCEIGAAGTAALLASLQRNPHCGLRTLSLSNNCVDVQGAESLSLWLQSSAVLEQVEVAGCRLRDEEMDALSAGIASSRSLRHLDLSANPFAEEGATALARGLAANRGVDTLSLKANNLCGQLVQLASALGAHRSLNSLDLSRCKLSALDGAALAALVKESRVLQSLNLVGNPRLASDGVRAVAGALHSASSLPQLRVSFSDVQAGGVAALAVALQHGWPATEIVLANNAQLGDNGALVLAAALEQCAAPRGGDSDSADCRLASLSLAHCGLTGVGALALLQAASRVPSLRDLRMTSAYSEAERSKLIAAAAAARPTLRLHL